MSAVKGAPAVCVRFDNLGQVLRVVDHVRVSVVAWQCGGLPTVPAEWRFFFFCRAEKFLPQKLNICIFIKNGFSLWVKSWEIYLIFDRFGSSCCNSKIGPESSFLHDIRVIFPLNCLQVSVDKNSTASH